MTREEQQKISSIERKLWGKLKKDTERFWRDCTRFILNRLKENRKKRNDIVERFKKGRIRPGEIGELFDKAGIYRGEEPLRELFEKYTKGELKPDELHDGILKYAIPDMFTREEILEGMGRNPDNAISRQRFYFFFKKMRDAFNDCLDVVWASEDYERYRKNGYIDEEIWDLFIQRIIKDNIYPMYSHEGVYCLTTLPSYAEIKTRRMHAVAHEIEGTNEEMMKIADKLPRLVELFKKPERRIGDTPYRELLPIADECPLCGELFNTDEELRNHLIQEHKAKT